MWEERLREPAFTSISGKRQTFKYGNVGKSFDKKSSGFDFSEVGETYVQDFGASGRRIPLKMFFSGDNHDLEADNMEALLAETGTGTLEHPIYGVIDVVVIGSVKRVDSLSSRANETAIEVLFWETSNLVYPSSQLDPNSQLRSAVDKSNESIASEFEKDISLSTAFETSSFKAQMKKTLNEVKKTTMSLSDIQSDSIRRMNDISDSINNSIDILVRDPLNLAFQSIELIKEPSRIVGNAKARLEAYGNLAKKLFSKQISDSKNNSLGVNEFAINSLFAKSALTSSILSVSNNDFELRVEATTALEKIAKQFEELNSWQEENFRRLDFIDTGESYQQTQASVALTSGYLINTSFSLKREHEIVLDRHRTIIDLCAELYGEVDSKLDFLIKSNALSGNEILEVPKGRRIKYYL